MELLKDNPDEKIKAINDDDFEVVDLPASAGADSADLFNANEDESAEELLYEVENEKLKTNLEEERNIQKVKSSLARQVGLKGYLYHIKRDGQDVSYTRINNIEKHVKDLEGHVHGLIEDNPSWPGGNWKLVIKDNRGKYKFQADFSFPSKPAASLAPPSDNGVVAQAAMKQNADMLNRVLENKGNDNEGVLVELIRSISQRNPQEEQTQMLALVQAMNPPKQESEFAKTLIAVGLPLIATLMTKMMEPKKEVSMIEQAQALKDLIAPSPSNSFNEAVDQYTRIGDMVNMMKGPGESSSVLSEAIRHLGPHIGNTLSSVAEGFKGMVDMKREALALQHGAGAAPGRRQISGPAEMPAVDAGQSMTEESAPEMHPTIKSIHDAVISKDEQFFPTLEANIKSFAGEEAYNGIVDGSIPIDTFVENFSKQIAVMAPVFGTPEMKTSMIEYMYMFMKAKLESIEANSVKTQCPKCGASFYFGSMDEFESDGKICGDNGCIATLEVVKADEGNAPETPETPEVMKVVVQGHASEPADEDASEIAQDAEEARPPEVEAGV